MKCAVVLFLVCAGISLYVNWLLQIDNPDVGLTEEQLVTRYGYPFENHTVETEDGYLLSLFRIPSSRHERTTQKKIPVFLMHGLLASSAEWILTGPDRGLAFLLADHGYDVWLGNARGTTWSRKHRKFSPETDKREFWDFSFHDVGYYDVPAFIDYILSATKQDRLHYVGHSGGTSSFFVMTSTRPEYNAKIRLMCGLSPVIYLDHTDSYVARAFAYYRTTLEAIISTFNIAEILPHLSFHTTFGKLFCSDKSIFQRLCACMFYHINGPSNYLNHSIIPVVVSSLPAGTSVKQFQHYGQVVYSKKFQHYDYYEKENLIRYGQPEPPLYDLTKVTAPVALYYGDTDVIAPVVDVERAALQFPNVVKKLLVPGFNHIDFTWATEVVPLLYNDMIKLMKEF